MQPKIIITDRIDVLDVHSVIRNYENSYETKNR